VAKSERRSQTVYAPYWCYTVSEYVRSSIAACNGGAGSCICMGPSICGGWGPFPPGSWQAYSYSCCGCHPEAQPAPVAAPTATAAPLPSPPLQKAASEPASDPAPPSPQSVPSNISGGVSANNATASAASACAAHKACADLRLDGSCCPAADGTYLGCCDSVSMLLEASDVNTHAKLDMPIPAWCAELALHVREISVLWSSDTRMALSFLAGAAECSRPALSDFLKQTLPAGAPNFLVQRPEKKAGKPAIKLPKHSNAAWVFFGRNAGSRILRGRAEHTDVIQHSGTWHVQLKGEKVWTLKPTEELRMKVPSLKRTGRVQVRCRQGDVLCINTRLWWHSTHIPARCKLSLSAVALSKSAEESM
ncbi:Gapdh, partial [Symbiodinium pilosum]